MRFVKPLDKDILRNFFKSADLFISLEDGSIAGGAGSAVQEFCSEEDINIRSKLFGIPDKFIDHASREEMIVECGLDSKSLEKSIKKYC
jgi:1-deoxy-D-xylulose-5-phosphate synthase